ncbi:MAG: POTRA domain-containing protein, partial [Pseudomonadota bacterium]|nr:POTRA domain-containing protein [Pseudomonadota bacterium]
MRFQGFWLALICVFACTLSVDVRAQGLEDSAISEAEIIQFIRVEGTQRVEEETVRAYMVVREGMINDVDMVDQSVKTLFASGLFSDVTIRRSEGGLVVSVVENPIVNRVSFEGNGAINDDTLTEEAELRPRLVYTRARVQDDVERFIEIYRQSGYFAARIEPKVVQLPQNRVDVIFEINEGPITGIRSINFVGNKAFDDDRLREEIITSETRWWRLFASSDNYDP